MAVTIKVYPESFSIRPNLNFSESPGPGAGYVVSQHENDNLTLKNALNAQKFNEYERIFDVLASTIGSCNGTIFSQAKSVIGEQTIGGAIKYIDKRLSGLESESGADRPATSFHFWLLGGNTFFDPAYTRGENIEDRAGGFYLDFSNISTPSYPDHWIKVNSGTCIVGTTKTNIKFVEHTEDSIHGIKRANTKLVDSTITRNANSTDFNYGNGERHTLTGETTFIYLKHRFARTKYFTNIINGFAENASIVIKVNGVPSLFTEGTDISIEHDTGKIIFSSSWIDSYVGLNPGDTKNIDIWYGYYQYRRDIIYLDSAFVGSDATQVIQVRRGKSLDSIQEVFDSTEFSLNNDDIPSYTNIDVTSTSFKNEKNLLYEVMIYPWNALDEDYSGMYTTGWLDASKEDNVVNYRIDATQSIVKWKAFDGIINRTNLIADYNDILGKDLLEVSFNPIDLIIDGRFVKTKRITLTLDTGNISTNGRLVAICSNIDGELTTSDTVSFNINSSTLPTLPQIPTGYDSYTHIIYIPPNVTSFNECTVWSNIISGSKTLKLTSSDEAYFAYALYKANFINDFIIPSDIYDSLPAIFIIKDLEGEFGNSRDWINLKTYIRLKYIDTFVTIPDTVKRIISDKQTFYAGTYTGNITIDSGKILILVKNLDLSVQLIFNNDSALISNGYTINYTSVSAELNLGGKQNLSIDAKINGGAFIKTNVVNASGLTNSILTIYIDNASTSVNGINLLTASNNIIRPRILGSIAYPLNNVENSLIENAYIENINTFGNNISFNGYIASTYTKFIRGNFSITNGNVTIGSPTVASILTVYGQLIVSTNLTVSGTSNFNGASTFTNTLTVSGTLRTNSVRTIDSEQNMSFIGPSYTMGQMYTNIDGGISYGGSGSFASGKLFNSVWNDIADFQKLSPGEKECPGMVYFQSTDGMKLCNKRAQKGVSGILSDTYGIGVGTNKTGYIPLAIGGWILAHVDKKYPTGTLLVNNQKGHLTKASLLEKFLFHDRIIATYARPEYEDQWGPEKSSIFVNGRHWVKVI